MLLSPDDYIIRIKRYTHTAYISSLFVSKDAIFAPRCPAAVKRSFGRSILNLKAKGTQPREAIPSPNVPTKNSKFDCFGDGDIAYREFCSDGCGGMDSEDPDYCLQVAALIPEGGLL
ncbi:hypothetical protein DL767_007004 [Monosporascus sp. MG133]|nr:hypothetical protein DL767_007004 [Monosporascus sp. MG133]